MRSLIKASRYEYANTLTPEVAQVNSQMSGPGAINPSCTSAFQARSQPCEESDFISKHLALPPFLIHHPCQPLFAADALDWVSRNLIEMSATNLSDQNIKSSYPLACR